MMSHSVIKQINLPSGQLQVKIIVFAQIGQIVPRIMEDPGLSVQVIDIRLENVPRQAEIMAAGGIQMTVEQIPEDFAPETVDAHRNQ